MAEPPLWPGGGFSHPMGLGGGLATPAGQCIFFLKKKVWAFGGARTTLMALGGGSATPASQRILFYFFGLGLGVSGPPPKGNEFFFFKFVPWGWPDHPQ